MPINKITAPASTPSAVADYTAQNNLLAALALAAQGAARVSGSNVLKGAVFLYGGSIFLADSDTAISGSASDYVKLTVAVDGLTLTPSFVADLTGVSWSSTWNGYYDVSGNLYEFDELKALAGAAISAAALRAIGGKNLGVGWAAVLIKGKYNGSIQTNETTIGGLYTALSSSVPVVGDKVNIHGAIVNPSATPQFLVISRALRKDANTITLYTISTAGYGDSDITAAMTTACRASLTWDS